MTTLNEALQEYTVDHLKKLAAFCGCGRYNRRNDLITCIEKAMHNPQRRRELWGDLDYLSRRAVSAAYHNGGELNAVAFAAQYGSLPERPRSQWGYWYYQEPIPFDLFVNKMVIPSDLLPHLAELVLPPDPFRLVGLNQTPSQAMGLFNRPTPLIAAETEEAGQHDLIFFLSLVDQGRIKVGRRSGRITLPGVRAVLDGLLLGDFFPLPEKFRAVDTIRPYGLEVFTQEGGLVQQAGNAVTLTDAGRAYYRTRDPEILLQAFERWTEQGTFDELERITALKGLGSRDTLLTRPGSRRDKVIEALSWCPAGVWIDIADFYRALKIWHFDFEVERTPYTNLYVESKDRGTLYDEFYWQVVKGLYINVILWEVLAVIGAVDMLYIPADQAELDADDLLYETTEFSPYDGLKYFRINPLGAFLLGQADHYQIAALEEQDLFTIDGDLKLTVQNTESWTPSEWHHLELLARPLDEDGPHYRLDSQQLLDSLEEGADFEYLKQFLQTRHRGPLPAAVEAWLARLTRNLQAFSRGREALFIEAASAELADLALNDPVLSKFCRPYRGRTLVIPASRQRTFRNRLKALEYLLAE